MAHSRRCLRCCRILASRAVRNATPWSQCPSSSGPRIEPALLARMRKVAWKASSAVCRSPTICRQTRNTIGPWRRTSAANAASAPSSRSAVNRESSSASPASATMPPTTNPSSRVLDSACLVAMIVTSPETSRLSTLILGGSHQFVSDFAQNCIDSIRIAPTAHPNSSRAHPQAAPALTRMRDTFHLCCTRRARPPRASLPAGNVHNVG